MFYLEYDMHFMLSKPRDTYVQKKELLNHIKVPILKFDINRFYILDVQILGTWMYTYVINYPNLIDRLKYFILWKSVTFLN